MKSAIGRLSAEFTDVRRYVMVHLKSLIPAYNQSHLVLPPPFHDAWNMPFLARNCHHLSMLEQNPIIVPFRTTSSVVHYSRPNLRQNLPKTFAFLWPPLSTTVPHWTVCKLLYQGGREMPLWKIEPRTNLLRDFSRS